MSHQTLSTQIITAFGFSNLRQYVEQAVQKAMKHGNRSWGATKSYIENSDLFNYLWCFSKDFRAVVNEFGLDLSGTGYNDPRAIEFMKSL